MGWKRVGLRNVHVTAVDCERGGQSQKSNIEDVLSMACTRQIFETVPRVSTRSIAVDGRNVHIAHNDRKVRSTPTTFVLPDCLHGLLPAPFLLSYLVFDFDFSLFFVSGPCARLSWPSHQLLSARKSTVSYRIVSYRNIVECYNVECCFDIVASVDRA